MFRSVNCALRSKVHVKKPAVSHPFSSCSPLSTRIPQPSPLTLLNSSRFKPASYKSNIPQFLTLVRQYSSSHQRVRSLDSLKSCQILDVAALPRRTIPSYKKPHQTSQSPSTLHLLDWKTPPRNLLLVKKPWQPHVRQAMVDFIKLVTAKYPDLNIMVEPDVAEEIELDLQFPSSNSLSGSYRLFTTLNDTDLRRMYSKTDMLITFGGDGTMLRAVSLFAVTEVPPVIAFSLGTLGFLVPFDINEAQCVMEDVYNNQAKVVNRRRLRCEIYKSGYNSPYPKNEYQRPPIQHNPINDSTHQEMYDYQPYTRPEKQENYTSGSQRLVSVTYAMNDINIHRGPDPHLTHLDIFCDSHFVTRSISDGVIVATPTGSTAYSLSAGGSIVHPNVASTLVTPICPRSLSFRPLVLPSAMKIEVQVAPQTRGQSTEISIDGIGKGILRPGDRIVVVEEDVDNDHLQGYKKGRTTIEGETRQEHEIRNSGIWCVTKTEGDWTRQLNNLLGFNSMFGKQF